MKIDLSKLLKGLEALPHMPVPEPENISPYVLTNILEPLKTDKAVSFMELDFKAFTEEDLENLCSVLSEADACQCQLIDLCSIFEASEAKAAVQRKFC